MISKTSIRVIFFGSLLLLLSVNFCIAAVQLDEKFLQSSTGNSSVSVQVERFIEDIKNMKLNDGSHPKILGWQRKGNLYTFSFTTPTKIELKFEHLVNQGGGWSSILAFEDGQPINAAALIMQISSMPRDKTKFDVVDEQKALEAEKQRAIEAALEIKKNVKLILGKYRDGSKEGYSPSVERILTITPFSDDKVYFEFISKLDDTIVCDTGKKVAGMQPSSFGRQLFYEEDDCSIKIDFERNNSEFEYYYVRGMQYQGTCKKYCNESFVSNSFKTGKGNLYPSVQNGMINLDADIKMQNLSDKKEKERWK